MNTDTKDHEEQKRSIRLSDWEPVATYGQTFPSGNETGACDVEVMVAGCGDDWYLRTRDDAGGSDECDATHYPSFEAATAAAKEFASEHDECDGIGASDWLDRERERAIEAGKSADGEYVLAHKDGTKWDKDRYSDINAARAAIDSWYDGVQAANPGTNIIWHLMDTPCLGQVNEDGEIEIVPDEDES